jgi:hypothetical protein
MSDGSPSDPPLAWMSQPAPESRPRSRRWMVFGCLGLVVIVGVAIVVGGFALGRAFGNGFAVVGASGGEIDSFHAYSNGGPTSVVFQAARGIDLPDGPRLACDVVRPTLASTDWASVSWVIVNRAGDTIATSETPCP